MGGMKYKTQWDLTLLYKSEKDPQIEKDVQMVENLCAQFEKKYKGKNFTSSAQRLAIALKEYHAMSDSSLYRPWFYFYLIKEIDANNTYAQAQYTSIEQRINIASNKVAFFVLDIAKIPPVTQKKYLKNKDLEVYRYYLLKIFTTAKYNLSEKEEQLLLLLAQTSETMWASAQQKLLGNQHVVFKGVTIPISEAKAKVAELPLEERYDLSQKISTVSKEISFMAEAELNAIYNFHNTVNTLKKYKTPYSASVLLKENTEEEIKAFAELVTEYFSLSQRFHVLHAKLLGLKKLRLADRRVNIGKVNKTFDFEQSLSLTRSALGKAGTQYSKILDRFIHNGQIDVLPRKGKQAGGFCVTVGELPTYILLNHTNDVQSVETFAHEMGHAIHGELSKKLPRHYQAYSGSVAEVASMFFEQFVGLELEQYLTEEEQLFMLHRKVCEDVFAIFCQIACFNYELELHERIKKEGQVSAQDMAEMMNKHMQAYCGPAMNILADDGYLFVTWHHLRYNFYTYTYAYGGLISRALFENWKKDNSYMKKIEQFLSAGGSMSPKDIFKSIGINTDKKFFEAGLRGIEADIDKLEKLSKNWLKNKRGK